MRRCSYVGVVLPRARGLALGCTLSPASTRAGMFESSRTQGSRIRPGLHAVAREYAGWYVRVVATQGSRIRPGLHAVAREYAGWYVGVGVSESVIRSLANVWMILADQ